MDVLSPTWGTLIISEAAQLVNISRYGVLIRSPRPLALGSLQTVRFQVGESSVKEAMRVRHVRIADPVDADAYFVGLEFVSSPVLLLPLIRRFAQSGEA